MTPCNPRAPLLVCPTCARYRPQLPHLAECRMVVCMDATVVAKNGQCQLHEVKPIPVRWWSKEAA